MRAHVLLAPALVIVLAAVVTALGLVLAARARSGPQSTLASLLVALGILIAFVGAAFARDDGRYAQSPLKGWFDQLRSKGGGPCCSDADGTALSDVDWDTKDGHYRVRLEGQWIDVPDDTVITEPNRAGRTMVWPMYLNGRPVIRCFMPGSMI